MSRKSKNNKASRRRYFLDMIHKKLAIKEKIKLDLMLPKFKTSL
jgi:hypothetical protein